MYLRAFFLAQLTPPSGGGDTAVIVAVIGAVGVVLGALITVLGQRNNARLAAIEKNQDKLGLAIERLERRMEDGLARLTERIDRLYGGPSVRAMQGAMTSEEALRKMRTLMEEQLGASGKRPFEVPDDLRGEDDPESEP